MSKRVQDPEAETRRESRALERYVERLQHERRPRRPHQMTPDQVRVHQIAALFRAASPGVTEPDPRFVARLQAQVAAAAGNCSYRAKE